MALDRWDPFREMMSFREAMDRWLQHGISSTGQLISSMRPDTIPMDVIEHDDAFEVRASVPGVRPEDVEVTVQGERVSVRAEVRSDEERRSANWLMREHRYGTLQRSITLPAPVSSEHAEARIEHGVLTLRLPKTPGGQARRITVASGRAASARPASPSPAEQTTPGEPGQDDRVSQSSEESFPASDAPSWTPEKV